MARALFVCTRLLGSCDPNDSSAHIGGIAESIVYGLDAHITSSKSIYSTGRRLEMNENLSGCRSVERSSIYKILNHSVILFEDERTTKLCILRPCWYIRQRSVETFGMVFETVVVKFGRVTGLGTVLGLSLTRHPECPPVTSVSIS